MKAGKIRPLAICVFLHQGRILVSVGYDSVKKQTFYRPLGGKIEFGEPSAETVRRELMEEIGIARPVHLDDGCHGYALSTPGHTHHMVCERCHAVVEIAGCELGGFLDRVAQRTGYTITGHWLEISGICAACQKQTPTD